MWRCKKMRSIRRSLHLGHSQKNNKERMCCVCRTRKDAGELLRIARIDGKFSVDIKGNANGRGAYICKSDTCLQKAVKTRALNRSYKGNVGAEVYETIMSYEL